MTAAIWMVGAAVGAWLAISAVSRAWHPELFWGMAAPLVSTVGTWIVVARTHATSPDRLTGVMVIGFALKAALFGAYVVVMLRVLAMRPIPFMVSFTGFFIALYTMEALFLRRLLRS
jgi:hypothetical protein